MTGNVGIVIGLSFQTPDGPPRRWEKRDLLYGNWEAYEGEIKMEKSPVTKPYTTIIEGNNGSRNELAKLIRMAVVSATVESGIRG